MTYLIFETNPFDEIGDWSVPNTISSFTITITWQWDQILFFWHCRGLIATGQPQNWLHQDLLIENHSGNMLG